MTAMGRSAAEERLLDAALAEVFGRPLAAATSAWSARRARWLAAALVLLGVAAVLGALLARVPTAPAPVQEPEELPLPLQQTARDLAELQRMPATTQNIAVQFWPVPEAELLRLRAVRKLTIVRISATEQDSDVQTLAPLCRLPALTDLELDTGVPWSLEPLRGCAQLRSLLICYRQLSAVEAERLVAIPRLRELRLRSVDLDLGFVRGLAPMPLEHFVAHWCFGFDAEAQRALASIRSLRSFEILTAPPGQVPGKHPEPLDRDAFAAICALPNLREVALRGTGHVPVGELLDLLPLGLESLSVVDELSKSDVLGLRRLGHLRQLTLWQQRDDDAVAELVGALRLRSFEGMVTPTTMTALAAQPDLLSVGIAWRSGLDLSLLPNLPALRRVVLFGPLLGSVQPGASGPPTEALEPLRRCRQLQSVRLVCRGLDAAAVQAVLREGIVVEIIDDPRQL